MASYHIRQRDPLFDARTRAALERRGRELGGLLLIGAAVAIGLMLGSYSPDDPAWMSATDSQARNALGRIGAGLAAPLFIIAALAAWKIVLILAGWGARLVTHQSPERALGRVIFAPIAVALASIYASTLLPAVSWPHSFGMGGLFGDTILGALLQLFPGSQQLALNMFSLVSAVAMLAMATAVLGVSRREFLAFIEFLRVGLIVTYWGILAALAGTLRGSGTVARSVSRRAAEYRANRAADGYDDAEDDAWETAQPAPVTRGRPVPVVRAHVHEAAEPRTSHDRADAASGAHAWRTDLQSAPHAGRPAGRSPVRHRAEPEPMPLHEDEAPAAPRNTLGDILSRVSNLGGRAEPAPPAELVDYAPPQTADDIEVPADDRILSRITDVIRSRQRQVPVMKIRRDEPPVVRPHAGSRAVPDRIAFVPMQPVAEPTPEHVAYYAADEQPTPSAAAPEPLIAQPLFEDESEAAPPRPGLFQRRKVVEHTTRKPQAPSSRAMAETQPALRFDEPEPVYELPPLSLLASPASVERHVLSDEALEENARMLENVLDDYGVKGEIVSVRPGPVVTMYELEPAPGLKASRVIGLADDIARSMSALSARVSTVPGRSVIGIELPNSKREKVVLREIIAARDFGDSQMRLPLALGKDIGGEPIIANLAKMPHLLIAGTTGSGKSVAINTMILSLLYKLTPEECRLIMIDPKMLELSVYDGIPHLLSPVVTDPKKAVVALKWVVGEMEERYRKMSKMGVRNIEGYNGRVREALSRGEMFSRTVQTGFDDETGDPVFETEQIQPVALPYIVVIVDEMADLMMVAGKEIEACIQRLAQMARASGIHLIMATQRPSVDVITGTIKANFPTRISFQVTSKIDSRTILGEMGAEQLLGMGDMLYMAGGAKIIRCHGPFVSDEEVEEVVNHLKAFGPPSYVNTVLDGPDEEKEADIDLVLGLGGNTDGEDALYDQAVQVVIKDRKCSTSYIQRKLGIGYNKAARLVEQMEDEGLVSSANHVGKREILVPEHG